MHPSEAAVFEANKELAPELERLAIANSGWTRILWRCWHDHSTYNPTIHHTAAA